MATPRKPKALKKPKSPKASASTEVWERYVERCKDIDKKNRERMAGYEKKLADLKRQIARKKKLIEEARKLRKAA